MNSLDLTYGSQSIAEAQKRPLWIRNESVRLSIYTILLTFTTLAVFETTRFLGFDAVLGEWGLLEILQMGALFLSALAFLTFLNADSGKSLALLAALPLLASIRELDGLFDSVFHGAWKVPFFVALVGTAILAKRNALKLRTEVQSLMSGRAAGMLFIGFLIVMLISRVMGQQSVWAAAMGDVYIRSVPRLIEEYLELTGYLICLMGAVEARTSYLQISRGARD